MLYAMRQGKIQGSCNLWRLEVECCGVGFLPRSASAKTQWFEAKSGVAANVA
ncbi:hypothetical protein B1R32_11060 [Abditibacterium utsteinense]|uniref:Uncharacterized protein n=1 Tax=Abditibacterium utsteinense TaxID=1960156 RepID=A0A2S8SS06_9BACT|nr:hypothetical protein B1R32_11060 [Abditibacterium utsteinense]